MGVLFSATCLRLIFVFILFLSVIFPKKTPHFLFSPNSYTFPSSQCQIIRSQHFGEFLVFVIVLLFGFGESCTYISIISKKKMAKDMVQVQRKMPNF